MQRTGFVFKKAGKWSSLMFTYSHNQKSVGIQNQVRKLPTFNSAASLHIRDLGELNSSKNRAKTHFVRNVYSPLSVTHSEWVVQLQEDDESEILLTCFWSSVRVWIDTMQSLSVKSWCFEWGTPEWGQNWRLSREKAWSLWVHQQQLILMTWKIQLVHYISGSSQWRARGKEYDNTSPKMPFCILAVSD